MSRGRNLRDELSKGVLISVQKGARKIIDAYDVDAHIDALVSKNTPTYWSQYERIEDELYQRLLGGKKSLMEDIKKDVSLYPVTTALLSVLSSKNCYLPVMGDGREFSEEPAKAIVGKAWRVLHYGRASTGEFTPLEDGDEIIIDSDLPGGAIRYKVEIDRPNEKFDPHGKDNFIKEHLIKLPTDCVKLQFDLFDFDHNKVEDNQIRWFKLKTKRIPQTKPLGEKAGTDSLGKASAGMPEKAGTVTA